MQCCLPPARRREGRDAVLRSLAIGVAVWLGAIAAAAAAAAQGSSGAGSWPERPVKVIVLASAGGGNDAVARVMAQRFGEILPQRFVLGVFSGIPVGLVTGYSRRAGAMISPIMAFIRPIPPITLTP